MNISEILQSLTNGWGILLLLIVLVAVYFLVKKGGLRIHTDKIDLGKQNIREQELMVVRSQWEYVHSSCEAISSKIPEQFRYTDKCKHIIDRVEDLFQRIIVFNHIRNDKEYKALKYDMVMNEVLKRTCDPYFQSKEFAELCKDFSDGIIDRIYKIRQEYSD